MYRQIELKKLTVDALTQVPDMELGKDFTVRQLRWNPTNYRRDYLFFCQKCRHKWRGHRRIYRENRLPDRCPKCGRKSGLIKVKKGVPI